MLPASTEHAAPLDSFLLFENDIDCWKQNFRVGRAAVPSRAYGMLYANTLVGLLKNATRRGGPLWPPATDGFVVWFRMMWLHTVSDSGTW